MSAEPTDVMDVTKYMRRATAEAHAASERADIALHAYLVSLDPAFLEASADVDVASAGDAEKVLGPYL